MSDIVENYLKTYGPSLSSEVTEHLVKVLNFSPVAARKQVSRARGEVRRLAYITFPRKARFIYLRQEFGSPLYWERLIEALLKTKSAFGLAIAAIKQRDGLIPEAHFAIACGAPLRQARHLSPDTIFQRLETAGLLQKTNVAGLGPCITLIQSAEHYDFLEAEVRVRLITEEILLTAIRDWVRKLGIVSYDTVTIRQGETQPTVGTFAWDLTAPCYLGCMVKFGKDGNVKPGFVACDVYLGDKMSPAGIQPFINKCVTLRMLRNVGACMQIFVANEYSEDAFKLLKKHGIIPATPRNLFGKEVAEGLATLPQVLRKAAASAIDPEGFDQLFRKLGKIEGASNQLRGTLFEFLVEAVVRKTISTEIRRNRVFTINGKKAEADVIAIRENQSVTFIECKGYNPDSETPTDKLRRWLDHRIPVFFKAIKSHPDWRNLEVFFEFWTTGSLSDEALTIFENAKTTNKPSRYKIELRQNSNILEVCEATADKGLVTAFRKHFTNLYSNGTK